LQKFLHERSAAGRPAVSISEGSDFEMKQQLIARAEVSTSCRFIKIKSKIQKLLQAVKE